MNNIIIIILIIEYLFFIKLYILIELNIINNLIYDLFKVHKQIIF